jgi:hypothetical protein
MFGVLDPLEVVIEIDLPQEALEAQDGDKHNRILK